MGDRRLDQPLILYLHGFTSGPQSKKAQALARRMAQRGLAERTAVRFRPLVYSSIAALIVSGLYRIISTPGHSPRYHALLGVKLLLAAHVFAVSALIVKKDSPRRTRLMTGAAISGFAIIAIASYLRRIF